MKTALNKSIVPQTKSVAEIEAGYKQKIEEAKEVLKAAAEIKEVAEEAEEFGKACDDERRAKEKIEFYERKLNEIKFTPRMDEDEYNKKVNAEIQKVESAAADFKKIAIKAITELKGAYDTYIEICNAADQSLEELDKEANVLQSKFRYHEQRYQGMPSTFTEDPAEWKRHAVRFGRTGKGYDLITKDGNEWNNAMCIAVDAAQKVPK